VKNSTFCPVVIRETDFWGNFQMYGNESPIAICKDFCKRLGQLQFIRFTFGQLSNYNYNKLFGNLKYWLLAICTIVYMSVFWPNVITQTFLANG
jgi:hypothetical protein